MPSQLRLFVSFLRRFLPAALCGFTLSLQRFFVKTRETREDRKDKIREKRGQRRETRRNHEKREERREERRDDKKCKISKMGSLLDPHTRDELFQKKCKISKMGPLLAPTPETSLFLIKLYFIPQTTLALGGSYFPSIELGLHSSFLKRIVWLAKVAPRQTTEHHRVQ